MTNIQLIVMAVLSIACSTSFFQPCTGEDTTGNSSGDCCTTCATGDDPLTIPGGVLRQLTNISEDSQGLLALWRNAYFLATENHILTSEVSKSDCACVCDYEL